MVIGVGLDDAGDAALLRRMLEYVGSFAYLQENIDYFVDLFLTKRSPALARALVKDLNISDKRRATLMVAMFEDAGYELDRNLVLRIYNRLANTRNLIVHSVSATTYQSESTGHPTIQFATMNERNFKGVDNIVTSVQLEQLSNEIDWVTGHLHRLLHEHQLMRFTKMIYPIEEHFYEPERPPAKPENGMSWSTSA